MKKKIIITLIIFLVLIVIACGGLFVFYQTSLKGVSENEEAVTFIIDQGTPSKTIINNLYEAQLIRNKYVGYIYLKFHNTNLQAGTYSLNRHMTLPEILAEITNGNVIDNSIKVTFVEGKRLTNYVKTISANFPYTEDEIMQVITDQTYLQELIDKYWFLTDEILNDKLYYALEGYLYPDTYSFYEDASIKDIIEVLLNGTSNKLKPYQDEITQNKYSFHELLTLASIIELEGASNDPAKDSRADIAGVLYNRLNSGMPLGSDVTTYYAFKLELWERDLTVDETNAVNAYNTRSSAMAGMLPVGPICNPSLKSFIAALNPHHNEYYYFVADKNGNTYFNVDYESHVAKINELKNNGLWYYYK